MADLQFSNEFKMTAYGEKVLAEFNKLFELEAHVGFQRGVKPYKDGTDLVDIAAFNEFGTSGTPARPFMKQSWENHTNELKDFSRNANAIIVKGGTAETVAKKAGAFGVRLVREEIVDGNFKPNAPSTIRKKKSATPLIDTGHMRQSVHYVIKKKGGEP